MLTNILLLHIPVDCWLPLLLACLLPFLLGWLLGSLLRGKRSADSSTLVAGGGLASERDQAIHHASDLEKEMFDLRYKLEECQKENDTWHKKTMHADAEVAGWKAKLEVANAKLASMTVETEPAASIELATAGLATAAILSRDTDDTGNYGALFASDNLQIVEGVGPKVEVILENAGIQTWGDLAAKTPEELRVILAAAGLGMMNPDTWPQQAQLAHEGKWDELIEYQRFLGGGREKAGDFVNAAKIEKMAAKVAELRSAGSARSGYGRIFLDNNLQLIEGIGPKVEAVLQENGIRSWDDLAGKSSDELKTILAGAGLSMMNPDSWPRQAQLAADGDWDNLASLQHTLDAGRSNVGDGDNPAKVDKLAEKLSSARLANREAGINFAAVFGSDNLQIIEGIGPKVSELLASNGISTWADLASKSPDEIQPILEAAGSAYKMMDPSSWPQQAKLAAEGQWTALIEYQKFLDGGKETTGDFDSPSKAEDLALKALGFSNNPEDLKIVEGIGPKIEDLLKAAGINTWEDLSNTSVARLYEILDAAGENFRLAKPTTWPRQAGLAADGRWEELKDYQDFLDKGSNPA
ncbi:MAG TPA: helix-hairpin-helix domain-containing protein [Haliscomenobacter sp.]|uniref:helix-hairpin-helix domain-containing protein n=1 Tax=Haliscomenobacter sp. TaxID=2717303 RepID=UPI002CFCDED2|nr:helix-hairpin-helix domain-containing protein [Haliscomenobacter sp.]HOY18526.1 helix-hairpin-helix domain-containing protein [Haliscomenobacter sp.]